MSTSGTKAAFGTAAIGCVLGATMATGAPLPSEVVPGRPGARLQAVGVLASAVPGSPACVTPLVQSIRTDRQKAISAVRRSIAVLTNEPGLPSERIVQDGDGNATRFTAERTAYDRVDVVDENANGRPDAIDDVLSGITRAQRLLVGQLELPSPGGIEIVLGRLGSNVEGVSLAFAGRQARTHVWLDSALRGTSSLRRAAEHQYAHAVATAAGLDPAWGEAFANWATLALEGSPDDRTLAVLASRLAAMGEGLAIDDLEIAGGNAAWFAFLHESYGPTAVKLAVEELGRGGSSQAALDRAIRRATGDAIDTALRDFHLWTVLVGPRDDGKHFSFADRLPAPAFAASVEDLPSLSVQSEPEVGPMGQAAVLIRLSERSGGLTVRFEGDVAARWSADLLLVGDDGERHRVPLTLDAEDAGDLSVPLQNLREAVLLVRNIDPDGRPARRYSWSAYYEPGFPVEFGALRADPAGPTGGAFVSWETGSEAGLLGFNVWRVRADGGQLVRVNPVWVPSLADANGAASYSFFDPEAEPGVAYRYRIEAVTLEGLVSRSESVSLVPAP